MGLGLGFGLGLGLGFGLRSGFGLRLGLGAGLGPGLGSGLAARHVEGGLANHPRREGLECEAQRPGRLERR